MKFPAEKSQPEGNKEEEDQDFCRDEDVVEQDGLFEADVIDADENKADHEGDDLHRVPPGRG